MGEEDIDKLPPAQALNWGGDPACIQLPAFDQESNLQPFGMRDSALTTVPTVRAVSVFDKCKNLMPSFNVI